MILKPEKNWGGEHFLKQTIVRINPNSQFHQILLTQSEY